MRYIKYVLLAVIAVVLISVSLANREMVNLELLPTEMAGLMGYNYSIDMPLFVVIFGGVGVGLLIGFLWEWIREYKQRAEAAAQLREMNAMRREIKNLKAEKHEGKDDVLALLDEAS
ncbi:lipopolysaccharide assembly protein LapA domain-containing protein [Planktotalea sp.]|uniref:lipopolysaccharide assembly protein LapA domain-containing protein n=1 Tax=Planktotalea sp. TaxID=2029877 RepID=UPI0025D3549F|nr:lipopolysaccharide assembly protein LapA domain-containing protein [Planktotalea sp.]